MNVDLPTANSMQLQNRIPIDADSLVPNKGTIGRVWRLATKHNGTLSATALSFAACRMRVQWICEFYTSTSAWAFGYPYPLPEPEPNRNNRNVG